MAHAAPPQLATQLLLSLPTPSPAKVPTSYPPIDKALSGGLDYGLITTIAGGPSTGKTLLACQTLLSHLLSSPEHEAAVIDTTGLFEPLWLLQLVRQRLFDQQQQQQRGGSDGLLVVGGGGGGGGGGGEQALEDRAMSVLERVRVMRVFDFVGVVEAVGEIRAELETGIVMDSQDEEEEEDLESDYEGKKGRDGKGKVGFLLVDGLMGVVGELMRTGHVQGHAVLTAFLRSLSLLTSRHQLCVILINGAVGSKSSTSFSAAAAGAAEGREFEGEAGQRRSTSAGGDEDVSIFASTKGKPALGRTFAQCVDVRLWLSRVPRRKVDAGLIAEGRTGAEEVGVCEVLGDRHGGREGRWGVFELK